MTSFIMSIDGSGKPNLVPFSAMWRYNCAFVDDPQNIKKLLYKGFGAVRILLSDVEIENL